MSSNSSMRAGSAPSENRSSCSCSAVRESVEVPECSYSGCKRPVYNDGKSCHNGRIDNVQLQRPAFCGLFHRDLYFSDLLERKNRPSAAVGGASTSSACIDTGHGIVPKCMLPECSRDVCMDLDTSLHHDFCSKRHMLAMRPLLVRRWSSEGTLCNLGDCVRHVWVEEDGRAYDFCSMSHATLAAARKGLPVSGKPETSTGARVQSAVVGRDEDAVPAAGGQCTNERHDQSIQKKLHANEGYFNSLTPDECHRLLRGELDAGGGPVVLRGIDIYQFHPWELRDSGMWQPRYFLHWVSQDSQKKFRSTKNGFAWKQNGPGHEKGRLVTTYFHYQDPRGKRKRGSDKDRSDTKWKMHEVTLLNNSNSSNHIRPILWKIWAPEQDPSRIPRKKPRSKLARDMPSDKFTKDGDSNDIMLEESYPLAVTQYRAQNYDTPANNEVPESGIFQNSDVLETNLGGIDGHLLDDTTLAKTSTSALLEFAASGQAPWAENPDMYTLQPVSCSRFLEDFPDILKESDNLSDTVDSSAFRLCGS